MKPNINESDYKYKKESGGIRFSLATIRNVGSIACKEIINEREKNGKFIDFFDFLTNSVMMPVSAFFVCILIIRVIGFDGVAKEVKLSSKFRRQPMYYIVTKYIAPFFLMLILASSIASALGFITI